MNRIIFLLVLLVLVAAGCASGGSGASDEASEPAATEEPTAEPTSTESESSVAPGPTLGEGAGELADLLPAEVGGIEITYQHTSGDDVIGSEGTTPEAQAFFERVGAEASDLSSAFGFAIDQESGRVISIVAFRVEGVDEDELRTEFLTTMEEQGDTVSEEQTVGGKTVQAFGGADSGAGYVYVKDDVVYIVGGEPMSLAEEALELLP